MQHEDKAKLIRLLENGQIDLALSFVKSIEVKGKTRTDKQHRALFKWFAMIEHEAENQGVTFDRIIAHTHQLRITKENLHELCKQLQKALWGTTSTKELQKIGQIEIIEQHFVDLFAKVGLELPPFPSEEPANDLLNALELRKKLNYPDDPTTN